MTALSVPITIDIVRGPAADALLADAMFCAQWAALADACPWGTPFQGPGFASTWYRVYRSRWEPLFALSRDPSGKLQGILPLAVSSEGELALAGAHQAEYQTWITLPALGDTFIWEAVQTLRRALPRATLRFHYLPPSSPRGWLSHPLAVRTCLLRTHRRPLMQFGDGSDVLASLAKRGNKAKLKRLARMGKVELRQLTDPRQLEAVMDDVTLFYDARRMAVNGAAPFAADPLKALFHLEMMKVPGLLHTSALMCGDRVASFHLNTIDRKHVQLSLITHNPLLADHSPGKYHVLMLAKLLMEQGYQWIDLTPGGDPYKERFANAWDEVYTLTVFGSAMERRTSALIESVAERTKAALHRWDIRPAAAEAMARKFTRPSALLHLAKAWLSSSQEARIYSRDVATNGIADQKLIRRDEIRDLMGYHPVNGGPTLHEFLADAMYRIEHGQRVYTYAENGKLLHYAWFAADPTQEMISTILPGYELPDKSAIVAGCYTVPRARGRGLGSASLAAMLRDAAYMKSLSKAFIVVPTASNGARRLVERAGFKYERSCVRQFHVG